MVHATCLYLFSVFFYEIPVEVYGDSLAFSVQICSRKQPEPGMVVNHYFPQALPRLIPEVSTVLLILYSKTKRIFVAIFILSVQWLVQLQTNASTGT